MRHKNGASAKSSNILGKQGDKVASRDLEGFSIANWGDGRGSWNKIADLTILAHYSERSQTISTN
jgi:hypothetical protein